MRGRPPDPRRQMYALRFNLPKKVAEHGLPPSFLDKLDRCKSNAARRILLGVSKKV